MNSYLRLATSASLIALGGIAAIGALALLLPSDIEQQVVARSGSAEPSTPCAEQSWLRLDRNCLSRRDLPWMSGRGAPSTTSFEPVRPTATEPSRTLAESQPAPATTPQSPAPQNSAPPSAAPAAPAQGSNATPPAKPAQPPAAAQPSAAVQPSAAAPPPVAAQRRAPKPAVEAQGNDDDTPPPTRWRSAHRPAAKGPFAKETAKTRHVVSAENEGPREATPKKTFRRDRVAKRSTGDDDAEENSKETSKETPKDTRKRASRSSSRNALSAVRRFGDSLPDVPVDAYAADGTRRKVIIRPTSIQDYYYYSVPR